MRFSRHLLRTLYLEHALVAKGLFRLHLSFERNNCRSVYQMVAPDPLLRAEYQERPLEDMACLYIRKIWSLQDLVIAQERPAYIKTRIRRLQVQFATGLSLCHQPCKKVEHHPRQL